MSLKNQILLLKGEGKTFKEISEQLNCAKSTVSYHVTIAKLPTLRAGHNKPSADCITNFKKLYQEHKSLDRVAKLTGWHKRTIAKYVDIHKRQKTISASQSVITWRKRTKIALVQFKGGKCEICGYNKCNSALHFHHKDPNEKDFTIGGKSLSLEKLKKEVDKCTLVCSNCHSEIHEGLILC